MMHLNRVKLGSDTLARPAPEVTLSDEEFELLKKFIRVIQNGRPKPYDKDAERRTVEKLTNLIGAIAANG